MTNRIRTLRRLVCACLPVSLLLGQPGQTGAQTEDQQSQVDRMFRVFGENTPGAAVAVVRNGEVLFRAGYGMADLNQHVPITPATVFDIASVSKQFGGFAIASLVESGLVDLDAEVREYLPELADFGAPLTVRHLVHHMSGIRDWPITLAIAGWRFDDVISFDQILRMTWAQKELNFPSGDEYSYSNTGYNLLAEIVQRATGQTFREWTDENIFAPLGMESSLFQDNHLEVVPLRARGHSLVPGAGWLESPNGLTALGSSSLHSSVDDLVKWLTNFDTHAVGGPAVIDRMHTRGVLNSGDTIAYAYGISTGSYRGIPTWSHTGSWAGNRTAIIHLPTLNAGIVVLSNSANYDPTRTANRLADIFFDDELGSSPPPREESEPADQEPGPTLSETALAEFTGEWFSEELDTRYVLSAVNGRLVADHYRHGRVQMTPTATDIFTSTGLFFRPVRFERNPDGSLGDMFVGQARARNLRFERAR